MVNIVMAPNETKNDNSIIFLAGPIQGARNWQKDAIQIISANIDNITVANPRSEYLNEDFDYSKQVEWETEYLNKASKNGVILFWLANEEKHICNRAFAQTTRFELAEWKTKYQYDKNIRIAIGIDDKFSNSRYIRKRLKEDCPEIKIYDTLEETCKEAIEIIKTRKIGNKISFI